MSTVRQYFGTSPGTIPTQIPRETPTLREPSSLPTGVILRILLGWGLVFGSLVQVRESADVSSAAFWSAILVTGCLIVTWDPLRRFGGATALYLAVFSVFHLGLLWALPVIGDEALVGGGDNSWVRTDSFIDAVGLVAAALAAVTAGAFVTRLMRFPNKAAVLGKSKSVEFASYIALSLGWALLLSFFFRAGGFGLFSGGYSRFFEASADPTFGYASLAVGLGCALGVVSPGRCAKVAWLSWIVFALFMLGVGARGNALYPLVAMIFAVGSRRQIRLWAIASVALLFSVLVAAIRVGRSSGIAGTADAIREATPFHAIAELGYSVYPVMSVKGWVDHGEPTMGGATLFVLPLRLIESILGIPQADALSDSRFFNVLIENRLGAVGGSPVAEAYMNGGLPFVLGLMFVVGLTLGVMDRARRGVWSTAVSVVILLPLVMNVRNFFSALPVYWVLGGLLLAVGLALASGASDRARGACA